MAERRRVLALSPLLFALAGCAGPFEQGVGHYDRGRYPEASQALQRAEGDRARLGPRERARYALYRGLTYFALGDRAEALRWLGDAKRAFDADPRIFSDDDGGRLASAWAHLPDPLEDAGPAAP
jgi:tetratricopeptide (TPR) repeat protein